ncbi:putative integral membrane protein [Tricladium varicosporioides]|nr:putative integral membrane protein [Hymenoscyphus varicosporioides]
MGVENRAPEMVVVTWLLATISLIFLALRVGIKLRRTRGLWWDDYTLMFSWVCLLIDCCVVSYAASLGFGKHSKDIPPSNFPKIGLAGNVSSLFSILAVIYSKTSFALTLLRIGKIKMHVLLWFIIFSVNISLGGSALMSWIQCTPLERNWNFMAEGKCWNPKVYVIYGVTAGVWSGCMDFVLAMLPWRIIWGLQIKKKEKAGVAIAMSMGVFAGITAIMKSVYIPQVANQDFTYIGIKLILWGAAESSVSIVAASIPILRVLVREATGRYYKPGGPYAEARGNRSIVACTSNGRPLKSEAGTRNDGESERGILGKSDVEFGSTREGVILAETEVRVIYQERNEGRSLSDLELKQIR